MNMCIISIGSFLLETFSLRVVDKRSLTIRGFVMHCVAVCENINAACQIQCNAAIECMSACNRDFAECTTWCPPVECDVNALSPKDKIRVNRSMGWSNYDAKADVTWWKGYSYLYLPQEQKFEQVFIFDGINVGATLLDPERCDTCYNKVSREISAYRDIETGQFLNSWNNTLTGELNEVRPVLNDPVNSKMGSYVPNTIHSKNTKNFFANNSPVFLKYPNYLAGEEYEDYSGYEWYCAAEIYGAFGNGCEANEESMERDQVSSWSRISQFLPWMEIGKNSPFYDTGYLLTHAFSKKLRNMHEGVPNDLMKWIVDYEQKYLTYPTTYETPNDTTWKVVKKLVDERRAKGEPDFQPKPNGPKPDKIDFTLPDHILNYFKQDKIEINYMSGEMVNYNYPDDFVKYGEMFLLDTNINIIPTVQSDGVL